MANRVNRQKKEMLNPALNMPKPERITFYHEVEFPAHNEVILNAGE
jgi:hypothetical protein